MIFSTSAGTTAVYSVTSAENSGLRVPGETVRDPREASWEASEPPLTFTAELPVWEMVTACPLASYTSWDLTVMDEVPAFRALNFSVKLKVVWLAASASPTTRTFPAPPLALVPLRNSRDWASYSSITSALLRAVPSEEAIFMVTDT